MWVQTSAFFFYSQGRLGHGFNTHDTSCETGENATDEVGEQNFEARQMVSKL